MEGIEGIVQTILDDASREAAEAWEKAQSQEAEIVSDTQADIDRKVDALLSQADSTGKENARRAATMADLDYRRQALAARQVTLGKAFDRALTLLCDLPEDELKQLVFRMILDTARGDEEILLSSRRPAFSQEDLPALNGQMEAAGKPGNLSLSAEKADIPGGFILRRQGISMNGSFEMLVRQQRQSLEREAADRLFSREEKG